MLSKPTSGTISRTITSFRDLAEEPGTGAGPLPIYRAGRDPKGRGRFGHRHAGDLLGDLDPSHQFHDEVGAASGDRSGDIPVAVLWATGKSPLRHSRIEDLRDVRVIQRGQRLPFRLEARHDLPAVHAQLDDLERHSPLHRLALLGHPDFAEAAFADLQFRESLAISAIRIT